MMMDAEGGAQTSCITSSGTPSTNTKVSLAAKQRDSRKSASSTPPFLSNLGKATLRGIRRCPQCGVFNGTRGISCKNKACGVALRSAPAAVAAAAKSSRKSVVEVVRLITDTEEKGGKGQEEGGALVQQVSKGTLVVKCQTDSHHPLGLLHFSVGPPCPPETSKGDRSVFHCACQVSTRRSRPGADGAGRGPGCQAPASSTPPQPCLHYYACVCALASSEKLDSQFAAFLSSSSCGVPPPSSIPVNPDEKAVPQPDSRPPLPKAMRICGDELSSGRAPPAAWKEGASASGPRKAAGRKAVGVKAAGVVIAVKFC